MLIKFRCPGCDHKLRAESAHAGRHARCSECKRPVVVPAASTIVSDDKNAADEQPVEQVESGPQPAVAQAEAASSAPPENPAPANAVKVVPVPAILARFGSGVTPPSDPHAVATPQAPAFITFSCPGCVKKIGFPGTMAGTPARCPACQLAIMVPDKSGGESFIIGNMPPPASPNGGGNGNGKHTTPPSGVEAGRMPALRTPPHALPHIEKNKGGGGMTGPRAAVAGVAQSAHAQTRVSSRLAAERPAKRRPAVWLLLVCGAALLAVIAFGGPRLQRLLMGMGRAQTGAAERQPAATPAPAAAAVEKKAAPAESDPKASPQPAPTNAPEAETSADPLEPVEIRLAPDATTPTTASISDLLTLQDKKQPRANEDDIEEPPPKPKTKPAPAVAGSLEKRLQGMAPTEEEKAEAEAAAKNEQAPNAATLIAARPAPAPLACEKCMGTKFLPRAPFVPYVYLDRDAPNVAAAVPWQFCPQCQAGALNGALVQTETERLKATLAAHRKYQEQTKQPLAYAETHHVSLHAQLPEGTLRQVGNSLEKLAAHLEQATSTTVLCQTRPNTHDIVIFSDAQGYVAYRGVLARHGGEQDERHRQSFTCGSGLPPPENMALFRLGRMLMAEASDGKAPAWLMEGFAAYCENAVTRRNLCYPYTRTPDEVKPGENWDNAIKRLAAQNKMPQIERFCFLSRGNMLPTEYAASYSLVSFLFKTDPREFQRLVLELRAGTQMTDAFVRVYGKTAKELQIAWTQWATR